MVYTYEMWDDDGRELAIGLYETGSRPTDVVSGGDQMPVQVRGEAHLLDSDDCYSKRTVSSVKSMSNPPPTTST